MNTLPTFTAATIQATPLSLDDPGPPSLVLSVAVEPKWMTLDDTAIVTVTVLNQSGLGADIQAALSFPGAQVAVEAPELFEQDDAWHSKPSALDAGADAIYTARVALKDLPAGGALLAHVSVTTGDVTYEDVGGALVADADADTLLEVEGDTAIVRAAGGQVQVAAPAKSAVGLVTQLSQQQLSLADQPAPPSVAGVKPGFRTVLVTADGSGSGRLDAEATLTHAYTPEQLQALGIDAGSLTLFAYDQKAREWRALETTVDPEAGTATARVTTAGPFQLSDGTIPSDAFIPSLRGWQVGLSTGTLAYQAAIDVPEGPAGIRPELALSYNSGATDGRGGARPKAQAGWVGKGWDLTTGSIAIHTTRVYSAERPRVALSLHGIAADLIRAEALVDRPSATNPAHWAWRSADEAFIKVRAVGAGDSTPSRGGFHFGNPYPRHMWQVWKKDGTRYEFAADLWWGFDGDEAYMEAYRWLLSRVVDPHGNVINYAYDRMSSSRPEMGEHVQGTVDVDCWPTEITWGGNVNTGEADRYRVELVSAPRSLDTAFDFPAHQYGGINGAPRETRCLRAIRVWSRPADAWQLVRQYDFGTDYSLFSDARVKRPDGTYGADRRYPKLTLTSLTQRASDGITARPPQRFAYLGGDGGPGVFSVGGWQRLSEVDNGQGGSLRLAYENIGAALGGDQLFANRHRIVARTARSGPAGSSYGRAYTWRYRYGVASLNSLGTTLGGRGREAKPNSAELYVNKYLDPLHDNSGWLLSPPLTEFRGHDFVEEIGPDDARVEHWFHTGVLSNDACPAGYPTDRAGGPLTGAAIFEHPCFQRLRDSERLKGREYRTRVRTSSGVLVSSVEHRFTVEFLGYTDLALVGGWRAFVYESERSESAHEGSTTPVTATTRYAYEAAKQGGAQLGNQTRFEQRDHAGKLLRSKDYFYAVRDDATTYIVDRRWQEVTRDGEENVLALTQHFYDRNDTAPSRLGSRGLRTRTTRYYDVRRQPTQSGLTLHGIDETVGYDAYGNVVEQTTYDEPSTRLWSQAGGWLVGPAGNGGPGATKTTRYDGVFHRYPVEVSEPNGLTTAHAYDLRLGRVVRTTDHNGNVTTTECDSFGRPAKIVRPGDSAAAPTTQVLYFDAELPVRYVYAHRERSGGPGSRPIQYLYDGLGREIQVKSESREGTQNIVVDKRYDAYGAVEAESQPRYVDESPDAWTPGSSFWRWAEPDAAVRWTTTRYDPAGRPLLVTQPDGSATRHVYEVQQNADGLRLVVDDTMDANRHRTRRGFDAFGRLVEVAELSGACGTYGGVSFECGPGRSPWTTDAVTTYGYDARDLLTRVSDAAGNTTTITYDGAGRKTAMTDPDTGSWAYASDTAGNLVRQVDALGRTTLFEYDALDRLTAKLLETWHDDFADGTLTGWSPRGDVVESAGAVAVTGNGIDWTSGLFRPGVASDRGGVVATFRVGDVAGGAVVALQAGSFGQPDYRRWGVAVVGGNLVATVWVGGAERSTVLMPARPGRSYRVVLVADAQQGFRMALEDLAGPGRRRTFAETHVDWAGRSWGFQAQARGGALVLEHYQEVDEVRYRYDERANGRGRQTAMSSPAEATTWSYDARGRVVEAAHVVAALGQPRTFSRTYDSADRVVSVTYPSKGSEPRETVTYRYDEAWRPVTLRSETFSTWYVGSETEGARYTALGQLESAPMANGTRQESSFEAPTQRLSRLVVRDPGGVLLERSYAYDGDGNVLAIGDPRNPANDQRFAYDHRGRMTQWRLGTAAPVDYAYDAIGNLVSKAGVAYQYARGTGGPHAVTHVGGQRYAYDRVGNLLDGGGRSLRWSAENLPTSVTGPDGVTETYGYDGMSARVVRRRAEATTIYVEGLWEEAVGGSAESFYMFHDRAVAVRKGPRLTSLHHDHLGSVSLATSVGGGTRRRVTRQDFDPWGAVRSDGIDVTSRGYTGHALDLTGLVDARARLYDPVLARFVSADTVVPVPGGCCCSSSVAEAAARSRPASRADSASESPPDAVGGDRAGSLLQEAIRVAGYGGTGECGVIRIEATSPKRRAMRPLTVAFGETDLLLSANRESADAQADGAGFDRPGLERLRVAAAMATADPQALNRYSYVLNNPLAYVDPSGHSRKVCLALRNLYCVSMGIASLMVITGVGSGMVVVGALGPVPFVVVPILIFGIRKAVAAVPPANKRCMAHALRVC